MKYFYEVFESLHRAGPGDNKSTRRAFHLIPGKLENPKILDIGCGPGMQTIELAKISGGKIIALDNHQPFLDQLNEDAERENVASQITTKNQSMLEMDFKNETFDIIWSEGALYSMGFQNGLKRCHQLLKKNGYLAVTEVVYLESETPKVVKQFWASEYPAITDVEGNSEMIRHEKFKLIDHFTLPKSSWLEQFYLPMEKRLSTLEIKYKNDKDALKVFDSFWKEIEFYKEYSDYYGYEFFVMQKR